MGALSLLAVAFVVSYFLVKLCARWPRGRRLLVAGLLLVLIPGAIVVPELNTHVRVTYSGALALLAGAALVLATVWVVMRNRATLFAGADEARTAPMPSEPESILSTSEPPLQRVVTEPPVQPRAAAPPQPSCFAPSSDDRIFVSYRRTDSDDVTGRIYDRLVQRFGKELIFKDVDSIPLGLDFREYVEEVVGRCNLLLAVVGDQWLAPSSPAGGRRIDDQKDLVRIEIEAALQRKIPVVPVLVRGASVPEENQLPPSLAGLTYRNGIKIRSDPDFHRDMDRLIAGMEAHLHPRA